MQITIRDCFNCGIGRLYFSVFHDNIEVLERTTVFLCCDLANPPIAFRIHLDKQEGIAVVMLSLDPQFLLEIIHKGCKHLWYRSS